MLLPFTQTSHSGHKLGQCQRLAQVLTLTQDMLKLAEDGQWQQVAELEKQRRDDLALCFDATSTTSAAPEHAELMAEALATMLHLNEELMEKLSMARQGVLEQGVKQNRNRSAIVSYDAVRDNR